MSVSRQQGPLFCFFNDNSSSVNVCLFIVSSALTWKTLWDYFFRFNAMSTVFQMYKGDIHGIVLPM